MRRFLLALVAMAPLSLAGCGSSERSPESIAPSTPEEEIVQSAPESRIAALNTPLQLGEEAGDDVVLTIKDITRSKTCRFGAKSQELVNRELEPNKQLLQITAELHVKRMDGSYSDSFALSDIKVRDSANYVTRVHASMFCDDGDSYNDWDERAEAGDKARVYGAFFVPEDIQEARIEGFKLPLDGNSESSKSDSKPRKMGGPNPTKGATAPTSL